MSCFWSRCPKCDLTVVSNRAGQRVMVLLLPSTLREHLLLTWRACPGAPGKSRYSPPVWCRRRQQLSRETTEELELRASLRAVEDLELELIRVELQHHMAAQSTVLLTQVASIAGVAVAAAQGAVLSLLVLPFIGLVLSLLYRTHADAGHQLGEYHREALVTRLHERFAVDYGSYVAARGGPPKRWFHIAPLLLVAPSLVSLCILPWLLDWRSGPRAWVVVAGLALGCGATLTSAWKSRS